jgi:L1 cell adhesion molecule like protein
MDAGSLYQLRNLINRRNVTADPTSRVSACEDFFLHVLEVHILTACMTEFKMSSVNASPSTSVFSVASAKSDTLSRRRILLGAIRKVLEKHVKFSLPEDNPSCREVHECKDHVLEYAREVLRLGLLYMELVDGIREGDGERIMQCWRYFLLLFKATNRRNNSIEGHFACTVQIHAL